MVFKGRFFSSSSSSSSSKKSSDPSSSPSNSPRNSSRSPSSFGSPLRSDSKKNPKKPDSPSPSSLSCRGGTPVKDSSSPLKKKDPKAGGGVAPGWKSKKQAEDDGVREKEKEKEKEREREREREKDSVAPILASSLGLNKIKTRSGPLPQESFYGFRGGAAGAKGVALGTSNLSRPSNGGSNGGVCSSSPNSGDRSSSGKKKDKDKKKEAGFGSWVADNGGSSPGSGVSPRRRNSTGTGATVLGAGSTGSRSGELLASGAGSSLKFRVLVTRESILKKEDRARNLK